MTELAKDVQSKSTDSQEARPEEQAETTGTQKKASSLKDVCIGLGIVLLGAIYLLPNIFTLEFFRHTEADRTLISMAMQEDKSYLVPHLFGDQYLTKPPLFYILMSWIFSATQSHAEWSARIISVLSGALLMGTQFFFGLQFFQNRNHALLSTLILSTTAGFYMYSSVAEIDMTFCFLIHIATTALFVSHQRQSSIGTGLSYALAGIAFLSKGPTALIFFGSAVIATCFLMYQKNKQILTSRRELASALQPHVAGAIVLCTMLFSWLILFGLQTSFADIYAIVDEELIQRFIKDPKAESRSRGPFFYLINVPASFLPWSLCFPVVLLPRRMKEKIPEKVKRNLPFALVYITLPLLFHSLASGKSVRYLFPVFPMLAVVTTTLCLQIAHYDNTKRAFRAFIYTAAICCALGAPGLLVYAWIQEQISLNIVMASLISLLLAAFLIRLKRDFYWLRALGLLFLFFFGARCIQGLGVDELRNHRSTVAPVVSAVKDSLPADSNLYVLELFERWIPYYLIEHGIQTKRITPDLVAVWKELPSDERAYVLLNKEDEEWRLKQIRLTDSSAKVEQQLEGARRDFLLISLRKNRAAAFRPRKLFPTNLSIPPESLE